MTPRAQTMRQPRSLPPGILHGFGPPLPRPRAPVPTRHSERALVTLANAVTRLQRTIEGATVRSAFCSGAWARWVPQTEQRR